MDLFGPQYKIILRYENLFNFDIISNNEQNSQKTLYIIIAFGIAATTLALSFFNTPII